MQRKIVLGKPPIADYDEQASKNETSTDAKEEPYRKHSLFRALLCAGHEIEFSFQNSLTIAGIFVIPSVLAWLVFAGFAVPLMPAVTVGVIVPLWFILLKARNYAISRRTVYGFGATCSTILILASFGLAYAMKPKITQVASPPPYSITAGTVVGGMAFWIIDNRKTSKCPVPLAVYINLINLQQKMSMVETIVAEGIDSKGVWSKLKRVDTQYADIYFGIDAHDLALAEIRLLDHELRNRNLIPGENVYGWILFDLAATVELPRKLRVTIRDTAGTQYTSAPFGTKKEIPDDDSALNEWAGFTIRTVHNNLDEVPIRSGCSAARFER